MVALVGIDDGSTLGTSDTRALDDESDSDGEDLTSDDLRPPVDDARACGVESMSAVPLGSTLPSDPDTGPRYSRAYEARYETTTQFEAADRIATTFGIDRAAVDELGAFSQQRAAVAWGEGRFDGQLVPVALPDGTLVTRDEGLRETSAGVLSGSSNVSGDRRTATQIGGQGPRSGWQNGVGRGAGTLPGSSRPVLS